MRIGERRIEGGSVKLDRIARVESPFGFAPVANDAERHLDAVSEEPEIVRVCIRRQSVADQIRLADAIPSGMAHRDFDVLPRGERTLHIEPLSLGRVERSRGAHLSARGRIHAQHQCQRTDDVAPHGSREIQKLLHSHGGSSARIRRPS